MGAPDGAYATVPGLILGGLNLYWSGAGLGDADPVLTLYLGPLDAALIEVLIGFEGTGSAGAIVYQTLDWEVVHLQRADFVNWPDPPIPPLGGITLRGGYGDYSVFAVDAVELPNPSPRRPFEILSATFAQDHYENGHPTDPLIVRTKSNWGFGSVSLEASLVATGGAGFPLGTEVFTLSPGEEHQSAFSFTVPANTTPWDFDIELSLTQGGVPVASFADFGFTGTPLSQAEIDAQVQELDDCAILPPGGGLLARVTSVATQGSIASPIIGGIGSGIGVVENTCREEYYRAQGDACREEAANTLAVVGMVSLGIAAFTVSLFTMGLALPAVVWGGAVLLTGFGLVTAYVGDSAVINWMCREQVRGFRTGEIVVGQGDKVRDLLAAVGEVGDSLGFGFSTHIGIEGPVTSRVSMPMGWISPDSISVDESAALVFAPDTLQWISITPQASRLAAGFDTTAAPTDSLWPKTIRMEATRAGDFFLGVAYRAVGSDATIRLFYPTVAVGDSTRMSVTIEDHLGNYPLEIDWTGDGQVDSLVCPEGASDVAVGGNPLDVRPGISRAQVRPNPFSGSAKLSFEATGVLRGVTVDIWDVSGRKVRSITVGEVTPGVRQAVWDGRADDGSRLSAGAYFYQVSHERGTSGPRRAIILR